MEFTGLFKVTGPKGEAIFGGSGKWKLPTRNKPGDWMPAVKDVYTCSSGYHLTRQPLAWFIPDSRLFVAEGADTWEGTANKTAFKKARLICEVTPRWKYLPLFPECELFLRLSGKQLHYTSDFKALHIKAQDALYIRNNNALVGCKFNNCVFERINIENTDLTNCSFERSQFYQTTLNDCKFSNVMMGSVIFGSSNVARCDFQGANIQKTDFDKTPLDDVSFAGSYMAGVDLSGCRMQGVNLSNAQLYNVKLPSSLKILKNGKCSTI